MATITPFVKRMRTQGGTIYTFSSALEDIGLNINERNNVVKMSHYALLNIPAIDAPPSSIEQNRFNVLAIPGAYKSFLNSGSIKDGRVIVAESFQNYALNLETNLLAQTTYNPALNNTVTERVFWKWLKETGAIRWNKFDTSVGTYFKEETDTDTSIGYNSVVKCIGQISAGSVRTDTFGTYNETYVLVPTSFGQSPVYFKQVEDDNYKHNMSIINGNTNILGRETYLQSHPDGLDVQAYYDMTDSSLFINGITDVSMYYDNSTGSYTPGWWWTAEGLSLNTDNNYFTDKNTYLTSGIYNTKLKYVGTSTIEFKRSNVDCISIEYDIDKIRNILGDSTASFDSLAIEYAEDDRFDFNAVLIYYSVYNKALDTILATNLLGILFLDAPSGNTSAYPISEISLPSITKLQSGPGGFGTSYSFRLNVKSDYMLDDTAAIIIDNATSSQLVLDDFSKVFDSLSKTLAILNGQTGTLSFITDQYLDITQNQTNLSNQINGIQTTLNNLSQDIIGTENVIPMFSSGEDSLVDSSIYMKNGFVGIKNPTPLYDLDVSGTAKTNNLVLSRAIYDASGHILLGYGSPLQLGSSTNYREITMYTGNPSYGLRIDTSNNVYLGGLTYGSGSYSLIYDNVSGKIYYGLGGSGSASNIAWLNNTVGEKYQVLTSNGDGSIYSNTRLYFYDGILSPDLSSGVGSGRNLNLIGGHHTGGGQDGGDIVIRGGWTSDTNRNGGDVILEGGGSIDGSNGRILIGVDSSTIGIFMGAINSSTYSGTKKVILYDTSTKQIHYGDVGTGSITGATWTGAYNVNGQIALSNGDGSIRADSKLVIDTSIRTNAAILMESSALIKAGDKTGSGAKGVDLTIHAGNHILTGPGTGGDIILKAGDASSGQGGNVIIQGGYGSAGMYATMGALIIGKKTVAPQATVENDTFNGVYIGGITPYSSPHLMFYNTSTGKITYDASTLINLGNVEASAGNLTIMDSAINASIGHINSSIAYLDSSKASLNNPIFDAGDLTIGGWTFRVDISNNLSIQHGHTVIARFTTDGSILVKGNTQVNQGTIDEAPKS